ncbi:MAG TPA: amino acid permease [Acidobacteriota bacterium]|nr:amino acid permease [Acidobacteriota bacterium]
MGQGRETGVKAKLTTFDTTMLVVSLVIGIGIFRTPAMVASETKTPLLFFAAWIIGGFVTLCGALTFAEIGARFNRPGAFYKVVAESYNSLLAFLLNWTAILIVNGAGCAAVALIAAEYLNLIILPPHLQSPETASLTACVIIIFLLAINYIGIKTGAWTQNILTVIKIAMIVVLSAVAFFYVGGGGVVPRAEPLEGTSPFLIALGLGLISVFYTLGGYQLTINLGADLKNARRNMPRAIAIGIAIIIALYLVVNLAYFLVLGVPGIARAKLVAAEVAMICFGPIGQLIISISIVISVLAFLVATYMQLPRSYYAMAEDGVLPKIFKRVNPKTQVQEFALLFLGLVAFTSILLMGTFENLLKYVMLFDSFTLATVASTVFILRRKNVPQKDYDCYKVPLYPWVPAIFVFFLLCITVSVILDNPASALIGAGIVIIGLPIFFIMRKVTAAGRF